MLVESVAAELRRGSCQPAAVVRAVREHSDRGPAAAVDEFSGAAGRASDHEDEASCVLVSGLGSCP